MDQKNRQQSNGSKDETREKKPWKRPKLVIEETEDVTMTGFAGVGGEDTNYRTS